MKRKLGLAAVIVLALFLLAACGGNGTDQNQEEAADTVTTASIVSEEEEFRQAISADGTWIVAILNDLTFEEEIVVEGTFHNGGDPENDAYRKIAAYAQDDERNVTDRYTITAPQMTISSPNTRFQGGVFEGDVVVEANGFTLYDATVEGNIYFVSEEYQESAEITEDSEVTGEMEVQ
ncbi:MAG: hypothetical protein UMU04_05830 [Halanaerobiales bacterium]|nr:hypothetical protein [Halanaerobiales bacterium]